MKLGKDSKRKRHANEFLRTRFRNSGRIAGMGILYDNYSENAYPSGMMRTDYLPDKKVDFPLTEEEMNFRKNGGPVITYKEANND